MIYFNLNAQPDKNAITSNADGGYEFSCMQKAMYSKPEHEKPTKEISRYKPKSSN